MIRRLGRIVLLATLTAIVVNALAWFVTPMTWAFRPVKPQHLDTRALKQHWKDEKTLIVSHDYGGALGTRLRQMAWVHRERPEVRVETLCASACTLYLGLPTACTEPTALWMFHRTQTDIENPQMRKIVAAFSGHIDRAYLNKMPAGLRSWIREMEADMTLEDEFWVTGHDLAEAGWINPCRTLPDGILDVFRESATRFSNGYAPPSPLPTRR